MLSETVLPLLHKRLPLEAAAMSSPSESPPSSPHKDPVLRIISHNRYMPDNPVPDLEYDVRMVPNPPRKMRAEGSGLDTDVQTHLRQDDGYLGIVSKAESDIREKMGEKLEAAGGDGEVELCVGTMCGSGHHRSVALAEELGRRKWPEEWKVEVDHRDVTSSAGCPKSSSCPVERGR